MNKSDLAAERLPVFKAMEFSDTIGAQFIEVSAKTGSNIKSAFETLCSTLLKRRATMQVEKKSKRSWCAIL
jgi:hypothetical protein